MKQLQALQQQRNDFKINLRTSFQGNQEQIAVNDYLNKSAHFNKEILRIDNSS